MVSATTVGLAVAALANFKSVAGHASIWHPSMWGFNVTAQTFDYDNRPVVPLYNMPFSQWWFHGHLDYPPNADDFMEFPAGETVTMQTSCDKGYTDYYASSPGGDNRDLSSNLACPGQPTTAIHANNIEDVTGCAIAIAYKSNVNDVQPEDFAIFTTNATCPWFLNTNFDVPADMPACPEGGCICAWFWIHAPDSGSEQMYMNGFQCKITGQTGNTPIGTPGLARRCGEDTINNVAADPSNCTVGPVQPFYWDQTERNNMFEGIYSPPLYNSLYGLNNGAQPSLYQEPTIGGTGVAAIPSSSSAPAPSSTAAPADPSSAASAPSSSAAPAQSSDAASAPSSSAAAATTSSAETVESSSASPTPEPTTTAVTTAAAFADTTTSVVASSTVTPTPTPSSTSSAAKCKRRLPGEKKKKRSTKAKKAAKRAAAIERHVKKRLAQESL